MIEWFRSYLRARRKRRYLAWVKRMRRNEVVFEKPQDDSRLWSTKYMETLRGRRY